VVTARVDQWWQLVVGCLGATKAPFSQGVLVTFRARLMAHDLDRTLLGTDRRLGQTDGTLRVAATAGRARLVAATRGRAHRGYVGSEGPKARDRGTRKNTLDVRQCATVANQQSLARMKQAA
jgi:hypothetical protein